MTKLEAPHLEHYHFKTWFDHVVWSAAYAKLGFKRNLEKIDPVRNGKKLELTHDLIILGQTLLKLG